MKKIEFFEECLLPTATAQTRRHHGNATYLPQKAKLAQAFFRAIMKRHAPESPFTGPIRLALHLTWPMPEKRAGEAAKRGIYAVPKISKPDLDNMAKLIIDAGTKAGWWIDDSQIAYLEMSKFEQVDIHGIAVMAEPHPTPDPRRRPGSWKKQEESCL